MKKIISSKSALVACIYAIITFFGFTMIALFVMIATQGEEKTIGIMIFLFCLSMLVFLLFYVNRSACVIFVEDGVVKRKGLVFGFYKECPVHSIRRVKIQYSRHEVGFGTFVYLVDDNKEEFKRFLRLRKDSYICFRKTKKNMEFLNTFWSGRIEK